MLASFMLSVDFNAVRWEGVKFRGCACQRRDLNPGNFDFPVAAFKTAERQNFRQDSQFNLVKSV
jgi:hypothetical protein